MPACPHALPTSLLVRAAAVLLSATAIAACGSGEAAQPAADGASGRAPDAAKIAALADERPATDLPPATVTTEQTLDLLLVTQPEPRSVGPYRAGQTAGALAFAARLVAATRTDPGVLCGPPGASPASPLSAPGLRRWLADPANGHARAEVETTISAAGTAASCGPLRWVGPGVVLGPQQWTVTPGSNGADLTVSHAGTIGYALADDQDRPEPWGLDAAVSYGLDLDAGHWRLSTWAEGARGRLAQGWPHQVAVPDGYLPAPGAPASDPDALAAVRAAADRWANAPASEVVVEQTVEDLTALGDGTASGRVQAVTAAAPSRGDAVTDVSADGQAPVRQLHLDGGERVLAATGTGRWTARDATAPTSFGVSAPIGAFGTVALLADADAAAPADCPDGLPSPATCWTAVVATADPDVPLAEDAGLARRSSRPYLVLDVAVSEDGLPLRVRVVQEAVAFGEPYARLTSQAAFTRYPADAPPAVAEPDPASVDADRKAQP